MKKSVVVIGPSRSGTSMASALVRILGVHWNAEVNASHGNPNGCFENVEHNSIISNISQAIKNDKSDNEIQMEFEPIIKKFLSNVSTTDKDIWGFKASPNFIEYFMSYMENIHIVYTYRNIYTNAQSGILHFKEVYGQNLTVADAMKRYHESQGNVINLLTEHENIPSTVVTYENMKSDPIKELEKIADLLDIEITKEHVEKAKEFIIPNYSSWEK